MSSSRQSSQFAEQGFAAFERALSDEHAIPLLPSGRQVGFA